MKKILTADKTESFFNEEIQECYHSYKGAVEEALQKYSIPCKIKELAKTGKIRILDVCSGLGYNSAKAIDEALEENPNCEVEVVCLELDPKIIEKIQDVNPPIKCYHLYKGLKINNLKTRENNIHIKLIVGDARKTCKQLQDQHFDAIFFDPFSPKGSPNMWETEFFKEMFRVMKSSGILATYSCARIVRDNMSNAGLIYDDGPIWGRRGPGTVATKWV